MKKCLNNYYYTIPIASCVITYTTRVKSLRFQVKITLTRSNQIIQLLHSTYKLAFKNPEKNLQPIL